MIMGTYCRTTVLLVEGARRILLRHSNAFGPKKTLSAGLFLFDALDEAEQRQWIEKMADLDRQDRSDRRAARADETAGARQTKAHPRRRPKTRA